MGFIPRGGERNFQRVSSANLSKDGFWKSTVEIRRYHNFAPSVRLFGDFECYCDLHQSLRLFCFGYASLIASSMHVTANMG